VEHTVTEEVTGVDLAQAQILLADGASLDDVGLNVSPQARGFAVQTRVNTEELDADGAPRAKAGLLSAFAPPAGPHVRVDTYGYAGLRTSPRFDSLLAKVIVRAGSFRAAVDRAEAALAEFQVGGVSTNIPFLRAVLRHPDFANVARDIGFVGEHLEELRRVAAELPVRFPEQVAETIATPLGGPRVPVAAEYGTPVPAPMDGV